MTSFRQIEANRRNAQLSTGPVTEEGKKKSRQNAVRHGLTAETVIDALEDAEDYAAFELAVTADYDAQSAVERELVLRLASLLWRLRRATAIESGLFEIQARQLLQFQRTRRTHQQRQNIIDNMYRDAAATDDDLLNSADDPTGSLDTGLRSTIEATDQSGDLTRSFIRLSQPADLSARPAESLRSHTLAPGLSDPVHPAVSRPAQAMGATKAALNSGPESLCHIRRRHVTFDELTKRALGLCKFQFRHAAVSAGIERELGGPSFSPLSYSSKNPI